MQFDKHIVLVIVIVIVYLHQKGDSQRAISWKRGISQHGVECVLKTPEKTTQVEDKYK